MEPDGSVELDGIQAQFPGITGIKYRNPATQVSENIAVLEILMRLSIATLPLGLSKPINDICERLLDVDQ